MARMMRIICGILKPAQRVGPTPRLYRFAFTQQSRQIANYIKETAKRCPLAQTNITYYSNVASRYLPQITSIEPTRNVVNAQKESILDRMVVDFFRQLPTTLRCDASA